MENEVVILGLWSPTSQMEGGLLIRKGSPPPLWRERTATDSDVFWCMKKIIPINTAEGCCRCIKAGYFKMGWTNFTREIAGAKDGFTATAILLIYDDREQEA